ncbi:hypothetical protein [Blastococcus sp. PRF04-17]|uniref:hypothetical protein n=1 Tax=Blastococcus sp. PRF04-17 TaxID=2933797 RepID=UPI001FF6E8E8|nr:hypothetical protein [Blastococcus sp. PRF04-17]UOX99887.1 hypothetical protein MVA48_12670 [Blastococcus sp. PRF04-17]
MRHRGSLNPVLLWSGVACGGVLGVVGGLSLQGPGLVAVALAGTLAACAAAGIAREAKGGDRRSTVEAAVQAAAWTVGVLLVLSGITTLAGGGVAALVVGTALAVWLVRAALRARQAGPDAVPTASSLPAHELLRPSSRPETARIERRAVVPGGAALLPPVETLDTTTLGQEWLTTTVALAGRLTPSTRQSLVGRRADVLDELERRDPDGFARWLAAGSTTGSDPAEYVRGGPVHDGPAADTA